MDKSRGKSGFWLGMGALGAGLLASACCLGPALLAAAGLGALGAGAALEAYRPWLLGATFVLLGTGFAFAYRKREVRCADGTCRMEGAGRGAKAALWSISLLALGAAFYPQLKTAATGACCAPGTEGNAAVRTFVEDGMVVTITGMTCEDCARTIRTAIEQVPGVTAAQVSLKDKRAVVQGRRDAATGRRIVDAVRGAGYGARVESPTGSAAGGRT